MGYIKEPNGVDFVVDPTPLSAAEQKRISDIIAYYKKTGRKKTFLKGSIKKAKPAASAKKKVA